MLRENEGAVKYVAYVLRWLGVTPSWQINVVIQGPLVV
jgi:hypothetical protein